MPLKDIVRKDPIITTATVQAIRDNPVSCEERYGRHYATYVSIPEVRERWDRVIARLSAGRPVLGAVYGPYGYGKTGAAIELWSVSEDSEVVSTPPFMCTMANDILEAAHAWVMYRIKDRRPELLEELGEIYQDLRLRTNEEWVHEIAQAHGVSQDKARQILLSLQEQGGLRLDALPSNVLRYLRKATDIVLRAGFKGLLVIPDEFKLFAEFSSDSDANISRLTELVWGVLEEDCPLGLVFFMPEDKFSEIRLKSGDITQRMGAHQVVLNLHQVYGAPFPKTLWEQMSRVFSLTVEERASITEEVLVALGQFCTRTDFFNGPRSVVATFKRAALKYQDTGEPYNIFDFVKDYTSGIIVFDGKESSTKGALSTLINLHEHEGLKAERAIQLLAAFPDGCPEQVAESYGLKDQLDNITRKHLGDHVITQVLGPCLRVYRIGEEQDVIAENLRHFRKHFNPKDASIRRATLRAFWNFVLPTILHERKGSGIVGWTGYSEWPHTNGIGDFKEVLLVGGPSKEYPYRKVNLRVTIDQKYWDVDTHDVHLGISILLDPSEGATHSVEFTGPKECRIRLAVGRTIDMHQIPGDIARLRDIFLPRDVTPLLLLSICSFLDRNILRSQAIGEQDKRVARFMVETSITQRVIKELFSEELRSNSPYHNLPIGETFLEQLLAEVFAKMFPDYVTLKAVPAQILERYLQALDGSAEPTLSLAQKRGHLEITDTKSRIANKFGYTSHATFRETVRSQWVSLMDLVDWQGAREDSKASIRLKLHPLEKKVLEELRASQYGTMVQGKKVKAIPMTSVYSQAAEMGYLEDEVDYIVRLLVARGYCGQIEIKGQKVLHESIRQHTASELLQAYHSFGKELAELCAIDKTEPASIFGSTKWELLDDINQLVEQEKANQEIEVALDEKQHQLDLVASMLKQYVASRVVDIAGKIHGQIQLSIQGKSRPFPTLLDSKKKSIPVTDFSSLLQNLQVELGNRFRRQQENYESLRCSLQEALNKYEEEKSKTNRIQLLRSLKDSLRNGQETLDELERKRKELEQHIANFENWLSLAENISQFTLQLLQQKDNNQVASALLDELNQDIVFKIKEYLANSKLHALADWEIFENKIRSLQDRWGKAVQERRKAFATHVEAYKKLLEDAGISRVDLDARYDDANPDLSQKQLVQDVKKHLEEVRTKARRYLDNIRNEILKAKKIYGLRSMDDTLDVESEWVRVDRALQDLFHRLTEDVIFDKRQFESWLADLKPFTEPEGIIADLNHRVGKTVHEVAKSPLEPQEEEVLQVIIKHQGNLTEAFVELLNENPRYRTVEDILPSVVGLYKKGRVNLEAKPIGRW